MKGIVMKKKRRNELNTFKEYMKNNKSKFILPIVILRSIIF